MMRRISISTVIQIAGIIAWGLMFWASMCLSWNRGGQSTGYLLWKYSFIPWMMMIFKDPIEWFSDLWIAVESCLMLLPWMPHFLLVSSWLTLLMRCRSRWLSTALAFLAFGMAAAFIPLALLNYHKRIPTANDLWEAIRDEFGWGLYFWIGSFLVAGLFMAVAEVVRGRALRLSDPSNDESTPSDSP